MLYLYICIPANPTFVCKTKIPTAVSVAFQRVVRRFFSSPKTGTDAQRWNPESWSLQLGCRALLSPGSNPDLGLQGCCFGCCVLRPCSGRGLRICNICNIYICIYVYTDNIIISYVLALIRMMHMWVFTSSFYGSPFWYAS